MSARHILFVATDRIGDLVWASAAIGLAREACPRARISVVASAGSAAVLEGNPAIDRLIRVRPVGGQRIRGFLSHVRAGLALRLFAPRVDAAVDCNRGRWNALVLWLAGARVVAGADPGYAIARPVDPREHLAHHRIALVEALLGVRGARPRPAVYPSAADRARADALVRAHGLAGGFVVVHAGTSEVGKHLRGHRMRPPRLEHRTWFEERYAAVATRLLERGLAVALTGVPAERPGVRRVIEAIDPRLRARAVDLCGATRPLELAALLERARLYVGGDTGPTHIAAAVGAPVVCVYGPSPPWRSGPLEPAGPLRMIYTGIACSPCDSRTRRACTDNVCMKGITADMVSAACADLLDAAPAQGTAQAPAQGGAPASGSPPGTIPPCAS